MAGNLNSDSVIWAVGEATGKDQNGASATPPGDNAIRVDAGVPSGAITGLDAYFDTNTRLLHIWNGSAWVTVSGA